jgi:DNA mismatch repair protein MutS2
MEPLFELEIGKPGSSFAFEIARNIGLPADVIEKASGLIGDNHLQFDKHLREISRDKRYWENKRQKIRQTSNEVDGVLEKYSEILKQTEKERKKILADTRQQADTLMAGINRKIEQAVREIKESQADKEQVKEIRGSIEKMRETVKENISASIETGAAKIEEARKEKERISKKYLKDKPQEQESVIQSTEFPVWVPGQKIKIKDRDIFGEVIEARGDSLLIAMGQMITTINAEQAELVGNKEFEQATGKPAYATTSYGFDLNQRKLDFSPSIDIRGLRADEALQKVTEFIDEAIMVGSSDLRILHGKGDGILRHLVRELLSGIDVVSKFEDEDVRFGGTGITLVRLSF